MIADRVVLVDGRPGIRPMIAMRLSCDHRAVDGDKADDGAEKRDIRLNSAGTVPVRGPNRNWRAPPRSTCDVAPVQR